MATTFNEAKYKNKFIKHVKGLTAKNRKRKT